MKGLGYLEETILLLIMIIKEDAYGFTIRESYMKHTGKSISLSAIHAVMSRLEKKGLVSSYLGGATEERGGRRKRMFTITPAGKEVLAAIKASRQKLWNLIPDFS
ncbi:MAG: PadR family transcriptional regulator [Bacteroidota bacterium]